MRGGIGGSKRDITWIKRGGSNRKVCNKEGMGEALGRLRLEEILGIGSHKLLWAGAEQWFGQGSPIKMLFHKWKHMQAPSPSR